VHHASVMVEEADKIEQSSVLQSHRPVVARAVHYYSAAPKMYEDTVLGDQNKTNPNHHQDGCSNCVAADALGQTVDEFNEKTGNAYAMEPRSAVAVTAMFSKLGLASMDTVETFDSTSKLIKGLKETEGGPFELAICWDTHIIRGRVENGKYALWDPQGSIGHFQLPQKAGPNVFAMWTLNAEPEKPVPVYETIPR